MKIPNCTSIDFETRGILPRPDYPPEPAGVSIKPWGKKSRYYAFAHGSKNNCTKAVAVKALKDVIKSGVPILFHHAKFDVDVMQTFMEIGEIDWSRIHDTQFLAFLNDPHAFSLALKPLAKKELGMEPTERDAVKDWILANVPEATPKTWGAFIWMAPGDLVGKYADGDVLRTERLFKHLYPIIVKEGMEAAYDRERQLMPIFLENERRGLRVDLKGLKRDIEIYRRELAKAEAWLLKKLGKKELNIDSDAELAQALDDAGIVTEWEVTKTGKRSTSKKTMTIEKFKDKKVFYVLGYRNRLTTCLRMFMEPWFDKASRAEGFIKPSWNQVRQPTGEDGSKGTRTGRPSCDNPNLLNIAKSFEERGDDFTHPNFFKGLLPLPLIRKYVLPDVGCEWLHRDYNQQELRILAHFEDGSIMAAYKANPKMDIHTFVQDEIRRIAHMDADRVSVKTMNFGKIYGQGLSSLALKLRRPVEEVKAIRDAQNKALPGLPDLEKEIKGMGSRGEPIVTWGGRVYYCEPPKFVEKFNREMTFEYKLLNYLIQGSAADATKEAIIRYQNSPRRKGRLLVTVYDEINVCVPTKFKKEEMQLLRECMEGLEFDVPLLTDGKAGASWGNLEKVKW